mmetsp:Transcript_1093/g.3190  ORF Transcript_1093/g.3190 Transcript_1093/m.3190 type:complete len:265 (+) Transcript_1093:2811-3605(+)
MRSLHEILLRRRGAVCNPCRIIPLRDQLPEAPLRQVFAGERRTPAPPRSPEAVPSLHGGPHRVDCLLRRILHVLNDQRADRPKQQCEACVRHVGVRQALGHFPLGGDGDVARPTDDVVGVRPLDFENGAGPDTAHEHCGRDHNHRHYPERDLPPMLQRQRRRRRARRRQRRELAARGGARRGTPPAPEEAARAAAGLICVLRAEACGTTPQRRGPPHIPQRRWPRRAPRARICSVLGDRLPMHREAQPRRAGLSSALDQSPRAT